MAKTAKKEKPAEKAEATEFKYGVREIAEELGIKETSVRVQLRNKGIEKAGKSYGWNTKAELKEVISQLSAGSKKSSNDDDEDEDEAPKAKKSKPAKEKPAKAKKAKTKKARDEEDEDEDDD